MLQCILWGVVLCVPVATADDSKQGQPAGIAPYERMLKGEDSKKVESLAVQVSTLQLEGKFSEAIEPFEKILEIRTRVQGSDHWQTSRVRRELDLCRVLAARPREDQDEYSDALRLRDRGLRLSNMGRQKEAEPVLRRVLAARARLLGDDHPETAESYTNLAHSLHAQGQLAEAELLSRKAHEIFRRTLGDDDPNTAASYSNLAGILDEESKFAEAAPLHRKALEILRRALGEEHPITAAAYNNVASTLQAQAKYFEAEPLLRTAMEIWERVLGQDHPNSATSYNNLAGNLHAQGKHAEAEPLFRKALEVRRRVLGEKHPLTAQSYNGLAYNLNAQGKYVDADPLYRTALEIRRRVLGEDNPDTARSYYNVSANLSDQGKYSEAEPLLRTALEIRRRVLGEDHPDTAQSYNGVAHNLYAQRKYAEAEPILRTSLELRRRLLGEDHPDTAESYANLAVNLNAQREYAHAEPLFRTALGIYRRMLGEDHPRTAQGYNNLAGNLIVQGKHTEAEPVSRTALEIHQRVLGQDYPDIAQSYNNVAAILNAQGKHTEAEPQFHMALEIRQRLLGEDHPDTAVSYVNLAANMQAQGKLDEAAKWLLHAADSFEAARLNLIARGLDRSIFGAERSPYPALTVAHARLQAPTAAWLAAETDLARGLADELASRRSTTMTSVEQKQQAELREKLAQLQSRILQLVLQHNPTDMERDELRSLRDKRTSVEHQLIDLAVTVSQREIAPLAVVQSAIPIDAALVLWVDVKAPGVQEHWGCVVRHTGEPAWERLSGTEANWSDDDSALPATLRDALASGTASASEVSTVAKALHDQRITPLAPHLDGVRMLYVVADKWMAGVPVELLTDKYTINYVPSGTFLARLNEATLPSGSSLLAVGDPVFARPSSSASAPKPLPPSGLLVTMVAPSSSAAAAQLQPQDVLLNYDGVELTSVEKLTETITNAEAGRAATAPGSRIPITVWREGVEKPFTCNVPPGRLGVVLANQPAPEAIANRRKTDAMLLPLRRSSDWNELPGTRVEVTQIAKLFGQDAHTLFDSAASEQSLDELRKQGNLSKFRYMHFATHGEANNVRALESVLILSQDNLPDSPLPQTGEPLINGQLSANEVLDYWTLNAELVTLSACETALGRPGGGDGLLGFAQSFLTAGSRAVCLSLWRVDDTATALLMPRFYQNLLGKRDGLDAPMPKAVALEEAKRWLRELSAEEASKLTAVATEGVVRGGRGKNAELKLVDPIQPKDARPFAHPRYWAAFVLIGDPN